jgi:hypothetical protein
MKHQDETLNKLRMAQLVSPELKLESYQAKIVEIVKKEAFDSTIEIDGITLTICKPYKFKKGNVLGIESKLGWTAYLGDEAIQSLTYGAQFDTKEHLMTIIETKFEAGFAQYIRDLTKYFEKISKAA